MNHSEARAVVIDAIAAVAPDADPAAIDVHDDLLVSLELDSMDLLNIAIAVAERTGIEIPERDYPKLTTIDAFAHYLAER